MCLYGLIYYIVASECLSHKLIRHLRAVRRKGSEKWRTNSWFLLRDNAPAHRSVLIRDFLAKNNVTTLEHLPPYPPDLAQTDFYLFPRRKSALKGRGLSDATGIAFIQWLSGMFPEPLQSLDEVYSCKRKFSVNGCTFFFYFSEIK